MKAGRLHSESFLVWSAVTWLGLAIAELLPAMSTGLPAGDPSSRRAFANVVFRPNILSFFILSFEIALDSKRYSIIS